MEHLNARIIRNKLGLLNLAQELGNVSKACKIMGLSRDTFYRWRQLGVAPPAIRLPNGELRVRRDDFLRWLDNLPGAA